MSESDSRSRKGPDAGASPWLYGVVGGSLLWIPVVVLSGSDVAWIDSAFTLAGVLAWVAIPLCAYLDIRYVRRHSDWEPDTPSWLFVMSLALFGQVFAGVTYLYRRHAVLGVP